MFVLYGFVALCLLAGISAGKGKGCGDFKPVENFNISQFMGTWHEHGLVDWGSVTICTQCTYSAAQSGKILVEISFRHPEKPNVTYRRSGEIRVPDASKQGEFEVTLQNLDKKHYGILTTDYNSYSILYECKPTGEPIVSVMTREAVPPESVVNEVMALIKGYVEGYSDKRYFKTKQSCGKKEGPADEKKNTKPAAETEQSSENTELEGQSRVNKNEGEKVVEQRKPNGRLSLLLDIVMTA